MLIDDYKNFLQNNRKEFPMDLINAFLILKDHYGTHCAAAEHIGITREHYAALRSGKAKIPKRTASYIILQAQAVQDSSSLSHDGDCQQPSQREQSSSSQGQPVTV